MTGVWVLIASVPDICILYTLKASVLMWVSVAWFSVRVSVFHLMFAHYTFSSVWVAA